MITGFCHICGRYGDLSFEHVPPKAAFNDKRTINITFEEAISLGPDEMVKGKIKQGGVGFYTLCPKCNNNTGAWYGKHFVDWCYQGMSILIRSNGKPTLIYMQYVFPLAIIKQIVTMFFSVNPPEFAQKNPELVRFVLNKDINHLSPKYRFFVYYNTSGKFRYVGTSAVLNLNRSGHILLSEITYPPFGYVFTIESGSPDNRLFEITHFADYAYTDFKVMTLKLPLLPTNTVFPGDYRTKAEVISESLRNKGKT